MSDEKSSVQKLPLGIPGFDTISHGGLPKGRTALIAGTVGSGKTVFAAQFLAEGIKRDEHAVFVTFEESPAEIRTNMASFGWDIAAWEEEGKWSFVDASLHPEETVVIGRYDLKALLARIEHAVTKTGASRISLDSIGAIFTQFGEGAIRRELFRILTALREMNLTGVVTAERDEEYGDLTSHGLEAFIADNVIVLRNPLEEMTRRRTIEIVKFRGTTHQKREYPFTVVPKKGIVVIPFTTTELTQPADDVRVSLGIKGLDPMCGGGAFRNSVIMVSGPSGVGKTVMSTEFVTGGLARGERSLLMSFEESHDQLCRNALGWGVDLETAEKEGKLRVICHYPEEATLEDTLTAIKLAIEEFKPQRMAIDSLSALERISSPRSFRIFVTGLTSFAKQALVTTLVTNTSASLLGDSSISETRISTLTDFIILLRYVELNGRLLRALTVVKIRGSDHDKNINEYIINDQGIHVGKPFRNLAGILAGVTGPAGLTEDAFINTEMERER